MSKRKFISPEQKVAIVRRHLVENVPVSELCDEHQIQPTQYYQWQRQFFENAAPIFERKKNQANHRRQQEAEAKKIAQLEEKLTRKNEVIAELMEENVQAKKANGEL